MHESDMTLYDPPTNYPSEMIPVEGKLRPLRLSYKILKDAVECCTQKFISGEWSESTLKAYAGTKGINSEGSNRIIEHGNYIMAYKYTTVNTKENDVLPNVFQQDHIDNPGKYKPWTGIY